MAPPRKKSCAQNSKPTFKVDQKVFAKLKGHPAWPAKILDVMNPDTPKMKYHVYFYATNETSFCKQEKLCDYALNKDRLGHNMKMKMFPLAIQQIELEIVEGVAGANMKARSEYEANSTETAEVKSVAKEGENAKSLMTSQTNSQSSEDISIDPRYPEPKESEKQDLEIGGLESSKGGEEILEVVANNSGGQEATANGSKEDGAVAVKSKVKLAELVKCGEDGFTIGDGSRVAKGKKRTKQSVETNVGSVTTPSPTQVPSTSRSGRVIKKKKFLYEEEELYGYAANKDWPVRTRMKMYPVAMQQMKLEIVGGVAGINMKAISEYVANPTEAAKVKSVAKKGENSKYQMTSQANSQNSEDISIDPRYPEPKESEKQDLEIGGLESSKGGEEILEVVANNNGGQEATANGSKEDGAVAVKSKVKLAELVKCGENGFTIRDGSRVAKGKKRTKQSVETNVGSVTTPSPTQVPSTSRCGRVIKKKKFLYEEEELYGYAVNKVWPGRTKMKMFPVAMEQRELEIVGGVAGINTKARSEYEAESTEAAEVKSVAKEDENFESSMTVQANGENSEDMANPRYPEPKGSEKQDLEVWGIENSKKGEETLEIGANDSEEAKVSRSKEDRTVAIESESEFAETIKCGEDAVKTRGRSGVAKGKKRTKQGIIRNVGASANFTLIQEPSTPCSRRVIKKKEFLYGKEKDYAIKAKSFPNVVAADPAGVGTVSIAPSTTEAVAVAPARVGWSWLTMWKLGREWWFGRKLQK